MSVPICQSCGMPMQKPNDFGTNADNSRNEEYCNFCFQGGRFTDEGITLEQKVEKIANIMAKMNGIPQDKVEGVAREYLPQLRALKRWSK